MIGPWRRWEARPNGSDALRKSGVALRRGAIPAGTLIDTASAVLHVGACPTYDRKTEILCASLQVPAAVSRCDLGAILPATWTMA